MAFKPGDEVEAIKELSLPYLKGRLIIESGTMMVVGEKFNRYLYFVQLPTKEIVIINVKDMKLRYKPVVEQIVWVGPYKYVREGITQKVYRNNKLIKDYTGDKFVWELMTDKIEDIQ